MSAATVEDEKVTIGNNDIDWDTDWTVLEELDFQPEFAEKCQALRDDLDCPNKATLLCEIKCCKGRILLCEDCFFGFYNVSKRDAGQKFRCRMCKSVVILSPAFLTVVKRIK